MHYRLLADRDLMARPTEAVPWTILRLGGLSPEPSKDLAVVGKTHISTVISRDDVAKALALLADRADAVGLALDIVGGRENEEGRTSVESALNGAIKAKTTWTLNDLY
jgi:hypothetical protein